MKKTWLAIFLIVLWTKACVTQNEEIDFDQIKLQDEKNYTVHIQKREARKPNEKQIVEKKLANIEMAKSNAADTKCSCKTDQTGAYLCKCTYESPTYTIQKTNRTPNNIKNGGNKNGKIRIQRRNSRKPNEKQIVEKKLSNIEMAKTTIETVCSCETRKNGSYLCRCGYNKPSNYRELMMSKRYKYFKVHPRYKEDPYKKNKPFGKIVSRKGEPFYPLERPVAHI